MAHAASIPLPLLDRIQIASPCPARWEDMEGDDRVRRCAQCNLDVHNIAGLTRDQAEALLANHFDASGSPSGGRLCAMLFRRADGTILTADCPVGVAALKARARRTIVRIASMLGVTSLVTLLAAAESRSARFAYTQPLAGIAAWLRDPGPNPALNAMAGKVAVMGDICIPSAPAAQPATQNRGSK